MKMEVAYNNESHAQSHHILLLSYFVLYSLLLFPFLLSHFLLHLFLSSPPLLTLLLPSPVTPSSLLFFSFLFSSLLFSSLLFCLVLFYFIFPFPCLTSLLLCSAFFASSTILRVSGFDDPSSARLEWSYTVRPSVSIGVSPSYHCATNKSITNFN